MPYWEMLGRAVVALESESESEQITRILTYSGLDAAVALDGESGQYTVTVPLSQEDAAKKLLENYRHQERSSGTADFFASDNISPSSPVRARDEDKIKYTTGSALIFLVAGGMVFVTALLHCTLVLFDYRDDSPLGCVIELSLGTLFLGFGIYTMNKVREIKQKIEEENQFTTRVIEWCLSTYPSVQLDNTIQAATENARLTARERYFLRKDLLRCYIIREFNVTDLTYLEYLTEETYISIFEKQKLGQKKELS